MGLKPTQMRIDLDKAFEPIRAIVAEAGWPEVTEGPSYGTPGLKVGKKFMARLREPDVLVVMCPLDEKEFLMEADPAVFFETDHYMGWPAVLVRLSRADKAAIRQRLERAWRMQAPKRVVKAFDAAQGAAS